MGEAGRGPITLQPLFDSYLERLQNLHADIRHAIEGLPVEALDWSPGHEMNSLAVLATHTAGAERYWIGDVIARNDSHRDRAAEFRARAIDSATLLERLDAVLASSHRVLEGLTLSDLETTRIVPRDGSEVTVAWALLHTLEHTAIHLGHMQLVRQLWEQRQKELEK